MAIAKRHAGYIKRAKEIRVPGVICDHATIVNVFSAGAVEAALNLYISIPLLLLDDRESRAFFGPLLTKHLRLSIRKKITFAESVSPDLKANLEVCKRVNRLFDNRNAHLHPSFIYSESSGIDFSRLKGLTSNGFKKYPMLTTLAIGTDDVRDSIENYSAACRFIKVLDIDTTERLQKKSSDPNRNLRITSKMMTRQR